MLPWLSERLRSRFIQVRMYGGNCAARSVALTGAQKPDGILVGAHQVPDVQDERPAKPFGVDRRGELREVSA